MALNDRSKVISTSIEDEMKTSYIDYSMSVIVSRALPDVRDGLKPSQRRILVAMNDLNLSPGRPYRKCAKIAGDTSGNYHPHGEQVVYPTLVRLAQDWVMRYPLVDGQGNFGCFTGDTRIRLLDGTARSFAELAALGPEASFAVYSVNSDGEIVIGRGRNARVTRAAAALVEIELDSGARIRCTPDHRFLLRDNTYKQAQDLTSADSLMPGYFDTAPVRAGLNDYLRIHQPLRDRWDFVHHLADAYNLAKGGERPASGPFVRHHKNFNRWDNRPENIQRMGFLEHLHPHASQVRTLWNDPAFRETQSRGVRAYHQEHPEARAARGGRMAARNRDPGFRAKNGLRVAATLRKRFAQDPAAGAETRQWMSPEFRRAQADGVRTANRRRLELNPVMMHELAAKSAESLRRCWMDDNHKRRVVRTRVARYVSKLLAERRGVELTPEMYESHRHEQWIPRLESALVYFRDFDELIDAGRSYNHRVVSVRALDESADVYDITVDEHHNFLLADGIFVHNSIDGDAPAAMRYTEARLTPLAVEMLTDLEKNTVDYRPNYDETREEPVVLPAVVPNLLVNGCSGIAVGMATEVPPHSLREICDAIIHVIDHPESPDEDLLKLVRGPDFPTGGIIYGTQGIRDCYLTGRGLMRMRAHVQVEEGRAGRMSLVATEIPFQINKTLLLERIADMVRESKLTGISDLRDESDRDGMRIVIELKKDANPKVVLNQLFVHTPLQSTFGAIMLALVDNRPQVLTLRALIDQYVRQRQIVVRRRTEFDLAEAEKRAHILEGLKIALDHLDAVIALIRASKDPETAREGLMSRFKLSEIQANAILEMRLQRLTGLERAKIEQEYLEIIQLIEKLRSILASEKKMLGIIQDEVRRLREKYGDDRRTEIVGDDGEIGYEDTIEQKDMVITISHAGYIKRQEVTAYRSQRRGGKGVIGARTKEEDYIEHLFVANTHAYLLILTDRGRCYWLKVHEVEQAGRMARGRPLVNHLEGLSRDERVQAVVAVKEFDQQHYLVGATRRGLIKKTVLSAYSHPRKAGINAILLEDGDGLIDAIITDGTQDLILAKKKGLAIRFHESEVRAMGRTSYGVKAVTLDDAEDEVMSMVGVKRQATLLAVTEHGYGKRSEISEYRVSHRGGKGIITIKTTERNGNVVAVKEVVDGDELMIITRGGQMIRMPVKGISVLGRNTQGVRLVNLDPGGGELLPDAVSGVTRVVSEDLDESGAGAALAPEAAVEAGGLRETEEEAPE